VRAYGQTERVWKENYLRQGVLMNEFIDPIEELRKYAVLHWPPSVLERAATASVLPILLETQDHFLSVLTLADDHPETWAKALSLTRNLSGNVFLKHLMVLTDLGGEPLNKLAPLSKAFPDGLMRYVWNGKEYSYRFQKALGRSSLTNEILRVTGKHILKGRDLDALGYDIAMLLIHGEASFENTLPDDSKAKCVVGGLIGQPDALEHFVRQNYIRVSRIIGGAKSNSFGQIAQNLVIEWLAPLLKGWRINRNGHLPGVTHDAGLTETSFDVIAISPLGRYFGIEVSFQHTTNSVIERKSLQAQSRQQAVRAANHHVCYVIDGAGNINVRKKAVRTIMAYSDCTVAFSEPEMRRLARFMLAVEAGEIA
jgi:hypothetical protein